MILYISLEREVFNIMAGSMLGYSFTPFGPEIVIPAAIGFLYDIHAAHLTYLLIISVVFVDIILGLFVLLNFELVEVVPKLGGWIKKAEKILSKKLKSSRETLALSALVLYVAMPFQGSGGFVGSIMGRVVGLNKYKVFLAVSIGSVLGAVPIGLAAYYGWGAVVGALQAGEDIYRIIGILIIIIFIIGVVYIIRRETKKRKESKREEKRIEEESG
jgi:uncharacterized membrane protein